LDAAIAIDPAFARALADRAYLRANNLPSLILEGATKENIDDFSQRIADDANKALSIDPNLGYAYVALAQKSLMLGESRDAFEEFRNALRLSPNDTEVLDRLGGYYSRIGDHDEAIHTIERAIELDPDNGELVDALADAMFYTGRMSETAHLYRRAIDLGHTGAGAYVNLGIAESVLGNLSQGADILRQAEAMFAEQNRTISPIVAYGFSATNHQEDADRLTRQLRDSISGGQAIQPVLLAVLSLAERDRSGALAILRDAVEIMDAREINFSNRISWFVISNNLLNDQILDEDDFIEVRQQMKTIQR